MHPERVAIDRTIATGTGSFRTIAKTYGLSISAVTRHVVNHLEPVAMSTPATVAQEVVKAVRDQQERELSTVARLWDKRLHETYATVKQGMDRAAADETAWTQVAKFGMAANSIIEVGMRACGTLAGGPNHNVTVNVEQLIVLPTPQTPQQRLEPTVTIDVNPTD
jgi:hypothetical protein